jgi:hypothetical protein
MYSSENCRRQMVECKTLLSSSETAAETTVLKLLVSSWRTIANQTDRYTEQLRSRKTESGRSS